MLRLAASDIRSVIASAAANAVNALSSCGGNVRPRFSARRKIPVAARGVKKYRRGARSSRTCDNEHTIAPLGHSEKLAVQHTPRRTAPRADTASRCAPTFDRDLGKEAGKLSKNAREVFAPVAAEKAIDILNDHPAGSECMSDAHELIEESGALSSQASTLARHAKVLAGEASTNNVNWLKVSRPAFSDIFKPLDFREVSLEHRAAERLNFNLPGDFESRPPESQVEPADARE